MPKELLASFGQIQSVMVVPLDKKRSLARVDACIVLKSIEENGYFLQVPPPTEALVETQIIAMIKAESKLTKGQHQQPGQ